MSYSLAINACFINFHFKALNRVFYSVENVVFIKVNDGRLFVTPCPYKNCFCINGLSITLNSITRCNFRTANRLKLIYTIQSFLVIIIIIMKIWWLTNYVGSYRLKFRTALQWTTSRSMI